MTVTGGSDVCGDPYDFDIDADPCRVWLRGEAAFYRNERYQFSALSCFGWETLPKHVA